MKRPKSLKIGWCRLTMMIELDLNKTARGFAAMRAGYMKALTEQGHTIKVLTGFGKRHTGTTWEEVHAGTYKKAEGEGDYDVSWLKSVEYDPKGFADDCDLLIVESSALNWMYPCKVTNKPAIRRCVDIINSFKGTVLVEQSDPDLPFPMAKLGCAKYGWSHSENPYRNNSIKGEDGMEDYGWADESEMWDGKEYFVCVRGTAKRVLKDGFACGPRFQYDKIDASDRPFTVVQTPQTYDFSTARGYPGESAKEHDIAYMGFPRNIIRERRFNEVMGSLDDDIKKVVSGPWTSASRSEARYAAYARGVQQIGNLAWHEYQEFAQKCKFSLYIGVPRSYAYNWKTNKPFEAIANGCVMLFDDRMQYLKAWFGKHLVIDGDYEFWSYFVREISQEDLLALWGTQYDTIRCYTWEYYLYVIEKATGAKLLSKKKRKSTKDYVNETRNTNRIIELQERSLSIVEKYRALYNALDDEYREKVNVAGAERMEQLIESEIAQHHERPECHAKEYEHDHPDCTGGCPFRVSCKRAFSDPTNVTPDTPDDATSDSEETEEVPVEVTPTEATSASSTHVMPATPSRAAEPTSASSALVINLRLPKAATHEIIINITQE